MINSVSLTGRLVKEPELRKTTTNKSTLSFTVAVNDRYNKEHTDFIGIVAWNQTAEFLARYAHKGDLVGITGRIQTRTWQSESGVKYVTEVVADAVDLLSSKRKEEEEPVREEPKVEVKEPRFDDFESQYNNVKIDVDDLPFF